MVPDHREFTEPEKGSGAAAIGPEMMGGTVVLDNSGKLSP